ncbi:MAG: glutamine-hydrolyzing carbamoyl-phosphate synthase small subunit [bacterium]
MKAILMLEDGKSFAAEAESAIAGSIGEVILNTAVVGYQQMLTDPANAGKILVLTYPLIGNYGCAPKFNESNKVWLSGLVIKEESRIYSNWQAKEGFGDFVKRNSLPAISKVDTRTLAVHLRQKGSLLGVISTSSFESKELLNKIAAFRNKEKASILDKISTAKKIELGKKNKKKQSIAVLDIGITRSLIAQLEKLGFPLTLLPYNTRPQEILRLKPKGLVVSNGPEEDIALAAVVDNLGALLGKMPILGISTGHQLLARCLGAKVTKMKLGHRGVNYPLHNPASYKGEITVQNHSWVVDADSLARIKGVKITGYNLNDRTVEEIELRKLKVLGVQYLPVSPGMEEVHPVFKRFLKIITKE